MLICFILKTTHQGYKISYDANVYHNSENIAYQKNNIITPCFYVLITNFYF